MEAKLPRGTTSRPLLGGVGSGNLKDSSVSGHIAEPGGCTCQARHVIGMERDLLQTIIPPWNISLVSLDLPTKFETVAIPEDALRSQTIGKDVKCEKVVRRNEDEIASLRAHIQEKEGRMLGMSGHGKTNVEGGEALGARGFTLRVSPPPVGKCVNYINSTAETQPTLDLKLHECVQKHMGLCKVDNRTGFTSDSEDGSDADEVSHLVIGGFTTAVQTNMAKYGVSSSVDRYSSDDVTNKRKYISVSEGPANIIYGRPKMTKSG